MNNNNDVIYLNNEADLHKWKEKTLLIIEIFDFRHALHEVASRTPLTNNVENFAEERLRSKSGSSSIVYHSFS
jgi:hypothetical protein